MRLNKKLSRAYRDWVRDETSIEMFRDDPSDYLTKYLNRKEEPNLLGLRSDDALTWNLYSYFDKALNEGYNSSEEFILCARYAAAKVHFESAFVESGLRGHLLPARAVFNLSLNILAGWRNEADTIFKLLLRGLDTSLLGLRHNDQHSAGSLYRHFWFLLILYSLFKETTLDTSPYSYPDEMSPYAAVLADWRTTDFNVVQSLVSKMADFHLSEAYVNRHDEIREFDDEERMLFPYEILSFLRLREWLGLSNPVSFEHPLMNQPLAWLPQPAPLPNPGNNLLDQVISKFKSEFPSSFI
jgi:hypothetical protein